MLCLAYLDLASVTKKERGQYGHLCKIDAGGFGSVDFTFWTSLCFDVVRSAGLEWDSKVIFFLCLETNFAYLCWVVETR